MSLRTALASFDGRALCFASKLSLWNAKWPRVRFLDCSGHKIQTQIEPTSLKTLLHFTV